MHSQPYNTSYLELAESYFKLNWPRTPTEVNTHTESGFIWNSLCNLCTDHTEDISASVVETCVLSLHSNCRGADNSEPIIALLPSNDRQTLLLLLSAFRGLYSLNSYCMGETRHTAPSLRLFHPEQPNGLSSFLSSWGSACKFTFLCLGSTSSISRRYYSTTTTSGPSLRPACLERFPDNLQSVRFIISVGTSHSAKQTVLLHSNRQSYSTRDH
jgi:hypothetical protein